MAVEGGSKEWDVRDEFVIYYLVDVLERWGRASGIPKDRHRGAPRSLGRRRSLRRPSLEPGRCTPTRLKMLMNWPSKWAKSSRSSLKVGPALHIDYPFDANWFQLIWFGCRFVRLVAGSTQWQTRTFPWKLRTEDLNAKQLPAIYLSFSWIRNTTTRS